MSRFLPFLALAALTLSACDSNDPEDNTVNLTVRTATNIAAAPTTGVAPSGQPIGASTYTLYSLRENRVVLNYDEADRSDSLSTSWDIGFNATNVIANPQNGGVQVVTQTFDEATEAPLDNFILKLDRTTDPNWYTYVPFQTGGGYILPTPGRTIVIRTADGEGYAKVRVRSYYLDSPEASTITQETRSRYYSFDYILNEGGRSFQADI